MLQPGSIAPDFVLPDETGKDVSLSGLLENGPLLLYFYPADFTAGCTREACSFRDIHGDIQAAGMQVVGISPQDSDSHARFRSQNGLPFRLLSDPDKTVIRKYQADGLLGIGVRRITYLIDENRNITDALQAEIFVGQHSDFAEKAIAACESPE